MGRTPPKIIKEVIFTPYYADVVGIYDVATETFTTVDTGLTGYGKFNGPRAVIEKVL